MKDTEIILAHLEKVAATMEELISVLAPKQPALYVDGTQQMNFIGMEDAAAILDGFGENCVSEMIGKTDYILVYDASKKLVIDGEAYLPSGYLIMKSYYGLRGLEESDISAVLAELRSRICTLALGQYRIPAYKLG